MVKKAYAVRIEPLVMKAIILKYGGLTSFVNMKIKRDLKLKEVYSKIKSMEKKNVK